MQRIYSFDQQTSLNAIREVSATANDSAAAMDLQLAQVLHAWDYCETAVAAQPKESGQGAGGMISVSMLDRGVLPGACLEDIVHLPCAWRWIDPKPFRP